MLGMYSKITYVMGLQPKRMFLGHRLGFLRMRDLCNIGLLRSISGLTSKLKAQKSDKRVFQKCGFRRGEFVGTLTRLLLVCRFAVKSKSIHITMRTSSIDDV